jgi:hypothetical protein
MTDFSGLLTRLSDCGVDFILVGGAAAVAHGSARLTQDPDIVYRTSMRSPNCKQFGRNGAANACKESPAGRDPFIRQQHASLEFRP